MLRRMADDTRLVMCGCGRSLVVRSPSTLRRVREETERGTIWLAYVDGHFHHVCSLM